MTKRVVAVIPARMASSRFPDKPLAMIAGLPMIEHVRRRAQLAALVHDVVVATCDRAVADVVTAAGGKAVMTADTHERATGRVAEAMTTLAGDVVAVIQGDEPLLMPDEIDRMVEPFLTRADLECVSVLSPLQSDADYSNPSIVKAACDRSGHIMYFSRAPIPFFQRRGQAPVFRETGLRAFRADFLQTYSRLPETPLERVESVDLMRVLEHGHKIFAVRTAAPTLGVDHPADVALVEAALLTDSRQQAIYEQIRNNFMTRGGRLEPAVGPPEGGHYRL